MTTVGAWLAAHRDLEHRDREVLLCRAAGLSRAQVMARPERPLPPPVTAMLRGWAARRRRGEPVAYILGEREFWGLALEVTPAVLVPRPETELLVEVALLACESQLPKVGSSQAGGRPLRILDLGTGSGAVAIAIAVEATARKLPVRVAATDVSAQALAVAARNARRHDAAVAWLQSDWFDAVAGRFDLIVSNPPYVAAQDPHLPTLQHEPAAALVSGPDGLEAIRAIVAGAADHLAPEGVLALEHGFDQGRRVRNLLIAAGFADVETLSDLAGLDRVTRARRKRRLT